MKLLLDVLNLVLVSFMAVSILGLFFKTLAGLSPYKVRFSRSQRSKIVYKASCWDCDSFYIGKTKRRLHDRKSEHFKALTKSVTPLLLQTILFLPVITSNGTILKSSQLERPTCSVKLKKRY